MRRRGWCCCCGGGLPGFGIGDRVVSLLHEPIALPGEGFALLIEHVSLDAVVSALARHRGRLALARASKLAVLTPQALVLLQQLVHEGL